MMTTYSTSFHAYFKSGGVYSGAITAKSRKELREKMKTFADKERADGRTELVTFEAPTKTVAVKAKKGHFVQFNNRLTNDFCRTIKTSRWYRRLA